MKIKNLNHIFLFGFLLALWVFPSHAQILTQIPNVQNDSLKINLYDQIVNKAYNLTEKNWRITGAISTVSGDELSRVTAGNLLNTLAARIPGLTVISGSGEPGYDNPTLVLRGLSSFDYSNNQNKMLVYLDGFEVDLGTIAALSAQEVESVTVLKDASSLAIYGLRGGNGAILVTTKKGFNNSKTVVTINERFGFQSAIQLPTSLDGFDYTLLYNQARQNDGLQIKYANPELYKASNDPLHPNVNWYDQVLKSSTPIQNLNIAFRGGNKTAKYFLLLDNYQMSGLYKNADVLGKDFGTNNKYNKYNIRANIELQLTRNFSIRTEVTGKIEDRQTPSAFGSGGFFNNLLNIPAAAFPVKNPNGSWSSTSVYNFNPVEALTQGGVYNAHTRTLQTNFSFNEKLNMITDGLSFNGGISFSNQYVGLYQKYFNVPTYEIIKDANDNAVLDINGKPTYIQHGKTSQGINDNEISHWNRNTYRLGFNYEKGFGDSFITGLISAENETYSYNGLIYPFKYQGISADVTYDYKKKYILNLSSSYNGTGDFAESHRYGFFPAAGLGWIISREDFMKGLTWVNFLKLKGSYGLTGSVNNNYRFIYNQWATNVGVGGWYVGTGNDFQGGWTEGRIGNADATWEKKTSLNLGFEAMLFKSINLSLDVFKEERTGIYQTSSNIPSFAGFQLPYINSGKVSNKGFEAVIKYDGKVTNDFQYYIGTTASFARNKIENMSEPAQPYPYLYQTGYRVSQFRGLQTVGYYNTSDFDSNGNLVSGVVRSTYATVKPGDLKYKDQNGDGIINAYDFIPMKYSWIPEWTFGLNLGFSIKGFDFNAFFQGVTNRTVVLPNIYTTPFVNNNNITQFALNSWTPATATTATSPRLTTQSDLNNLQTSDFYMRDGSFIKLRDVELGYTFKDISFLAKNDGLRIYVNGSNLITWDKIQNLEAENLSMGYPLVKSVSFGLKVKF